ncbi:hypothetical protein IWQ60_007943 [Tieghemiomyces parasiticus]|uniref:Uncharacterized protein n=1 Tax=Tieghemiomyces parasiticus TaxID=78921 RepID=A0A9W7ZYM9_9FUNG|nr:hypothetical protein IWQ60_007943 [Tieghemiomyces parasiticus]
MQFFTAALITVAVAATLGQTQSLPATVELHRRSPGLRRISTAVAVNAALSREQSQPANA